VKLTFTFTLSPDADVQLNASIRHVQFDREIEHKSTCKMLKVYVRLFFFRTSQNVETMQNIDVMPT
jgi:hypothetical protein